VRAWRLADQKGPYHVGAQDLFPVVDCDRADVRQRHVHGDASVVYQVVKTPPPLRGGRDQSGSCGRVADVALDVHRVAQLSGDALARLRRGRRVDDDSGAEATKTPGNRRPDAARGPCDDDGLTGEVHADSLPLAGVRPAESLAAGSGQVIDPARRRSTTRRIRHQDLLDCLPPACHQASAVTTPRRRRRDLPRSRRRRSPGRDPPSAGMPDRTRR
jgi:hypothetical protein